MSEFLNLVKTDVPGLYKDRAAIINKDEGGLESYRRTKNLNRKIMKMETSIIELQKEISYLKNAIDILIKEKANG